MKKTGFTLIELLVVIAIIAILAAILFPVFSQARKAAKVSQCISNYKQVAIAQAQYRGDNDGKFVLTNHTAAWAGCSYDYRDQVWVTSLQGYVKEWTIFRCPSDPTANDKELSQHGNEGECPPPANRWERNYEWSLRTNVGMNSYYLSPVYATSSGWGSVPTKEGRIASTANTFLHIDTVWNRDASGKPFGGGNWIAIPPARTWVKPDGTRVDTWPLPGNNYYPYSGWHPELPNAWDVFGGCWPWHTDKCTTVFVDGHAKSMTIQQIAAGVPNVVANYAGPITDIDAYKWDITQ